MAKESGISTSGPPAAAQAGHALQEPDQGRLVHGQDRRHAVADRLDQWVAGRGQGVPEALGPLTRSYAGRTTSP